MECIFLPEINKYSSKIDVPHEEAKHLKALHVRPNEKMLATNGCGIVASIVVNRISKEVFYAEVIDIYENYGELDIRLGLAIGMLDNRDRFEFVLEKCTELGVTDFYQLITDYSQKKTYSQERLQAKAIATIKQCKRSKLPNIYKPMAINEIFQHTDNYKKFILAHELGIKPIVNTKENTLIFVGPEGGFSEQEINILSANSILWSLGNRRLRAETAAILTTGLISTL